MRTLKVRWAHYGVPVGMALLLAVWMAAEARETDGGVKVCRRSTADGWKVVRVDLTSIENKYRRLALEVRGAFSKAALRAYRPRDSGHDAGLPSCRRSTVRRVVLPQPVPKRYRKTTFYFVRARRNARLSSLLPRTLPREAEIFALSTDRLESLAALSRAIKHRVSLANKDFAAALGVRCADSRVTLSEDGRTATVSEDSR